jgi:hypothetical protein
MFRPTWRWTHANFGAEAVCRAESDETIREKGPGVRAALRTKGGFAQGAQESPQQSAKELVQQAAQQAAPQAAPGPGAAVGAALRCRIPPYRGAQD